MNRWTVRVLALALTFPGTILSGIPGADASSARAAYPYCVNGGATDPDGDGWGWENNASCVVRGSRADTGVSRAPNGYPYCANGSATDPDGDGWGWEYSTSCVVPGGRADNAGVGACPARAMCGSYAIAGLGSRKNVLRAAGADSLDLAVAMLETDTMQATYPYGDNKNGDAANFGIFKQNWLMLRVACNPFAGRGADQYNDGAVLNRDLVADVSCMHQGRNFYGTGTWFAGHRNGATGLANPTTPDIAAYRNAIYWIKGRLDADSANMRNDIRYWVAVPAI